MADLPRVDITKPKWDQSNYLGRAKHFFLMTNPLNILATPKQLNEAKDIVDKYKTGKPLPPGTTIDDVWKAKYLYDSAFHPETGEKMILIGRMSAQMPMNTLITGAMMTFYKTNTAVIFWQWMNQTFNAVVNYTNRSGDSPIPVSQLGTSYVLATFGALSTALYLNKQVTKLPPIFGRWVPFAAVAAANCINIPCMRLRELREGVHIVDSNNNRLGSSCKAAREGIAQVVVSRIFMCTPSMFLTPMVVEKLDQRGLFKIYPKGPIAVNLAMCAVCLTFATPLCCALFTQQVAVNISRLEQPIQETAKKLNPSPQIGYYNKGL